jgi:hypothetical protein
MVGNEEGNGHQCRFLPTVRCAPGCRGLGKAGTSFLECGYTALENQSRPADADAKNKVATEADPATRLHDKKRGGTVLMGGAFDIPLSQVLSNWLVYWKSKKCDHRP